jgi:hypothetical protein
MASTSPIRAEVPSITSTIAPSWPSGLGPEMWSAALSHWAIAARITFTPGAVSASGMCGSRYRRDVVYGATQDLVPHSKF